MVEVKTIRKNADVQLSADINYEIIANPLRNVTNTYVRLAYIGKKPCRTDTVESTQSNAQIRTIEDRASIANNHQTSYLEPSTNRLIKSHSIVRRHDHKWTHRSGLGLYSLFIVGGQRASEANFNTYRFVDFTKTAKRAAHIPRPRHAPQRAHVIVIMTT